MKFSEMQYHRPDIVKVKEKIDDFTDKLKNSGNYENAREIFTEFDKYNRHIQTLATLAHIRHTINTNDKYYNDENSFWDSVTPEITEHVQAWTMALLKSPFRNDFEKEFGKVLFLNAEIELKTFSPEIIPELQEENNLVTEYGKLIASAQIPFNGKTYTISQLSPFKNDSDDNIRLAAWKADGNWYKQNQAQLDSIYDKLVHLRNNIARKLGYENFVELGYYRMGRNCYSKDDVEKFRAAVREYLVPVADGIYREQAKRLGKQYPMSFADNALSFRSGNPKPSGGPDEILLAAKKFYDSLSPETSEFWNKMLEDELLDLLSTEGKMGGGYCTGLYDYNVPFIFANFNGTSSDVKTVTHEAGHAFADWMNSKRVPMKTIWPSMEGCEVHSMSMEFFAWRNARDFFGDDTRKFLYSHLAGSLTFIPYGTMVDHFQHIVYENPDMTPAQRHESWKNLLEIYMPWMKLDGEIPFYSEGQGWQRQLHIYQVPFYYIDYCLAQTVALEFWAMIQEDSDNAWNHYMAYTKQGGSKVFTELLASADLESPFDENCLKHVSAKANQWLADYDLSGIE